MNDSSQKLPGWVSDDLRPLVYERGLEDKVMELDKSFVRENILEALQELLPRDEIVSRSQTDTLPNQSVHSRPAHSEKSISREEQLGGAEVIPLTPAIPVVASSLMSPLISYTILTLLFLAIIWIVGKKIWDSWSDKLKEKSNTHSNQNYFLSSSSISKAELYDRRPEVRR
jgi:hypothetical protein